LGKFDEIVRLSLQESADEAAVHGRIIDNKYFRHDEYSPCETARVRPWLSSATAVHRGLGHSLAELDAALPTPAAAKEKSPRPRRGSFPGRAARVHGPVRTPNRP